MKLSQKSHFEGFVPFKFDLMFHRGHHFKSEIANICKFVLQIWLKIIFYEMQLEYQVMNTSQFT